MSFFHFSIAFIFRLQPSFHFLILFFLPLYPFNCLSMYSPSSVTLKFDVMKMRTRLHSLSMFSVSLCPHTHEGPASLLVNNGFMGHRA
ncbi:hypothetical protein BO83DRAFT_213214 [Aspergillus eucalypticola CBS 122712]|uniref:Uncharacterized protein n=1 Tax=Aspergillus eucalypticola (strain CBS 122712 / IBT 29274) TaxID=1448314 RepID=A0A317VY32_ASPEC|nr:uncharacterized protein BO83DRAFT_213214 [Aspergillus eucalypticola CBS 122712]PWY78685.1 hypothetical protein BO83DRAFT_213214 [Aspergillus eucalypticola CBS 122712]